MLLPETLPFPIDPAMISLALDQSFNAVVLTDGNLGKDGQRIVYANPAFCQMTGYSQQELLGQTPRILQGPATNPDVIERLRECLREGSYFHGSTINYRKDGRPYTVEWNISPVRNAESEITHFISVQQDVSDLMAAQKSTQIFASVLNATEDGVVITNSRGIIEFANKGFEKITGYGLIDVLGRRPSMLSSGHHDAAFYEDMWGTLRQGNTFRSVFTNRSKNNALIHCDETITPLCNEAGEVTHYVSIFRDVTSHVLEASKLRDLVRYDSLTGALSRAAGELALQKAYMQSLGGKVPMSIAMADIDHFKQVNDKWGHSRGDTVLKAVSHSLIATLRANDSVIRWGGEEFLLIFSGCGLEQARPLAERCRDGVQRTTTDEVGQVTVSIGVAELQLGETVAQLIERADKALYAAKHAGRNQVQVSSETQAEYSA